MASSSLRALLRETEPRDFPLKAAWIRVIRLLRAHRRAGGRRGQLSSREAVERALDSTVGANSEQLLQLKSNLRMLVRDLGETGEEDGQARGLAVAIDELVTQLLRVVATGAVELRVTGWPARFPDEHRARMLRRPLESLASLAAGEAAALVREFDGMVLGGARLSVVPMLAPGMTLPAVPRGLRARPMLRGRKAPWLPHLDEEGRHSLTDRALAEAHAALVTSDVVVDGYAGCGGNAIAFALAGHEVVAVERDGARLELARRNARHLGAEERIRFHHGELQQLLPDLLQAHPGASLFLDPPWREDGGIAEVPRWPDLLPGGPSIASLLPSECPLLLKLPRSFNLETLPERDWQWSWDFGEGEQSSVVLMLTLWSKGTATV